MGPWVRYTLSVCEVIDIGDIGVNNNNNNNNKFIYLLRRPYNSRKANYGENTGRLTLILLTWRIW